MKRVSITCDSCQRDLRFTAYESECRLALNAEPMDHKGGAVYGMSIPAEISNRHFCNLRCLSAFLATLTARITPPTTSVQDEANKKESGQALIESTLILLVFLVLMIGIVDFGQFFYFNQSVNMRLDAGARYAAVHGCKSLDASVCAPGVNMAVYNDATGSGPLFVANFSASSVTAGVRPRLADPSDPNSPLIVDGESVVTVSVRDYPIDLLLFPRFHRSTSVAKPLEWYQCYARCSK